VLKSVSSVSPCESHWSGAARLPLLFGVGSDARSASKSGSDSLLMQFGGCVAL